MRNLITLILVSLFVETGMAQEVKIETQSVELENLISFIAKNYPLQSRGEEEEDVEGEEEIQMRNITFLIETSRRNLSSEDAILIKQAFKFLSKRLEEQDLISIVAYSGINGLALEKTSPKKLKKILNVINDFKSSIEKSKDDGIAFAYKYAKDKFEENALNSVVMIRNPNASKAKVYNNAAAITETEVSKPKSNVLLLTALTLLPELISIIKD